MTLSVPRKTLSELRAAEPPRLLATHALRQLSPRDYPEMIIRRMIGHSDIHDWGSAMTLREFAKDPLVVKMLSDRLRIPEPGSVYIASELLHADPQSLLLPSVLEAAPKAMRSPGSSRSERFQAARLIVEKGTDSHFSALFELFRAARRNDTTLYVDIFQSVSFLDLPRVKQLAAFMLDDRRIYFGQTRYCDLAGANLQGKSSEEVGFAGVNQPLIERDLAVEKASRWMKTQAQ